MSSILAIALRELGAIWRTPIGWVAAALYAFLTGLVFVETSLAPGEPASLRYFFGPSGWLLVAVAPALSMRLFSNESPLGAIDMLRASPVSAGSVASGKVLGAAASLPLLLAPTLGFPIVLFVVAAPAPDLGPIVAGYAGLLLIGLLYVCVGGLASALFDSPILAFLAALIVLIALQIAAALMPARLPADAAEVVASIAIQPRLADFARGIIDTRHVATLLMASVWLVALCAVVTAVRRPRS
ncbi:MAG: hypothetical protein AAGI17_09925 [Planctomycetota bacterium]